MFVAGQRRCPGQAECRIYTGEKLAAGDVDVISAVMVMALKTDHSVLYDTAGRWTQVGRGQCPFLGMHRGEAACGGRPGWNGGMNGQEVLYSVGASS